MLPVAHPPTHPVRRVLVLWQHLDLAQQHGALLHHLEHLEALHALVGHVPGLRVRRRTVQDARVSAQRTGEHTRVRVPVQPTLA